MNFISKREVSKADLLVFDCVFYCKTVTYSNTEPLFYREGRHEKS